MFDAFRLEVRYDRTTHEVEITAVLDDTTATTVREVGDNIVPFPVERTRLLSICLVGHA
jgi:hypothetical protein